MCPSRSDFAWRYQRRRSSFAGCQTAPPVTSTWGCELITESPSAWANTDKISDSILLPPGRREQGAHVLTGPETGR